MICLSCALERIRDRRSRPCADCLVASLRNPRAEAWGAVARYIEEWDRTNGMPDLVGLPISRRAQVRAQTGDDTRRLAAVRKRERRKAEGKSE